MVKQSELPCAKYLPTRLLVALGVQQQCMCYYQRYLRFVPKKKHICNLRSTMRVQIAEWSHWRSEGCALQIPVKDECVLRHAKSNLFCVKLGYPCPVLSSRDRPSVCNIPPNELFFSTFVTLNKFLVRRNKLLV